jgi:carotenoid cleavage dioxygenase-like enzyme
LAAIASPKITGPIFTLSAALLFKGLALAAVNPHELTDSITEFGMLNGRYAGLGYRYAYAATGKDGWFQFDGLVRHDLKHGTEERYAFADGCTAARPPWPRRARLPAAPA